MFEHQDIFAALNGKQPLLEKIEYVPAQLKDRFDFIGRIAAQQYQASYTMLMIHNDEFFGFLFFNSYRKNAFDETTLQYVDMLGHLLSLLVIHEMARPAGHDQDGDPETGADLDRMSNYARLIAKAVAGSKFDTHCVAALIKSRSEVESIQRRFREDTIG